MHVQDICTIIYKHRRLNNLIDEAYHNYGYWSATINCSAQDSNNVAGMGYTSILHKNDNHMHAKNYLLQISYVRLCKQHILKSYTVHYHYKARGIDGMAAPYI